MAAYRKALLTPNCQLQPDANWTLSSISTWARTQVPLDAGFFACKVEDEEVMQWSFGYGKREQIA